MAALVRRKKAGEALDLLKFTPKKGAKILAKVIKSAVANAENNFKQDPNDLILKEIIVTQGPFYKRFRPISRGRSHPLLKKTSHIRVSLEVEGSAKKTTPAPKPVKPSTTAKTTPPKTSSPTKAATPTPVDSEETKPAPPKAPHKQEPTKLAPQSAPQNLPRKAS